MSDEMGSSSAATSELAERTSLRVLGPLVVVRDGRELHVAGTQRRRLLAFLASRPGRATSVDAIVDVLWPDDPPPSAAKTVQSHVVRLRRSLAPLGEPIATVPGGYRLDVEPEAVDAVRFEALLGSARAELADNRPTRARAMLGDALAQWRGTPYIDAGGAAFADAERVRLDELRLAATEDLAEAELLAGAAASAVPELERLVTTEPGRERAWSLLMRCLYALGRQHDALVAFQRARRVLAESFGLEPGPALRAVERQVLEQDPTLATVPQAGRLPAPLRSDVTLVGRETELAWLRDAWSVARAGNGQVRVLGGPPGSGRTELLAALARLVAVAGGATVEYLRAPDGLEMLVADGAGPLPGRVVDAVTDRSRKGPMLLVVDDVDATPTPSLAVVEALAEAAARLSLLLILAADRSVGGPAAATVRRIEQTVASSLELPPMSDSELRLILRGDGADDDTARMAIAVADGLPGAARREAAAWMERAASERLSAAAASSIAAVSAAGEAHDSVFDEVLALVAARARRDALSATTWTGRKPYRALAPYGPEDADLFVGRERLVAELAARVLDRRLVAVVGASGSGKSSIVRAGLDPLVRSGRLPGGLPWRSHVMVPGADPIGALLAIEQIDDPGPQLLVVDQFEEIAASGAAEAFAGRLLDLVLDSALDVHVVVVVRADQYGTLARLRHLVDLVGDAQVLVGPPSEDELRRIATQPASRTGCTVEPELVELLVADVAGQDGTLPLASAALAEVWDRRRDDVLTAEQYVEIGGLAAAVERLGEGAVQDASEDGVRDLLLRVVDITDDGQWVRRRVATADVPPELATAADALVAARLVVRDGEVLDIVHEIVFRAWPRLASWLEDARADLVIDRDLRTAARAWEDHGRSDDDVYRGSRLHTAVEWIARHPDAGTDVTAFVAASSRVAEQENQAVLDRLAAEVRSRRRLGRALVAAAVLLVVSLVGAGLAVLGQRSANDARRRALGSATVERDARASAEDAAQQAADREREATEQRAGRQEERLLGAVTRNVSSDPQLAMLLAVEADRRFDSPETRSAVYETLSHNFPDDPFGLSGARPAPLLFDGYAGERLDPPVGIAISDDGSVAAAAGRSPSLGEGVVLLLDMTTRKLLRRVPIAAPQIESIDVSADGQLVLVGTSEHVDIIDVATGTVTMSSLPLPRDASGGPSTFTEAFLLPSGNELMVAALNHKITLWDRISDTVIDRALPDSPLNIAGPAPDGTLAVASGSVDTGGITGAGVGFWDLGTGTPVGGSLLEFPPGANPSTFSFSSDMRYLAGSTTGELDIWDLTTGQLTAGSTGAMSELTTIAFDPARPELLAIGESDGQIRLYDVADDVNEQPPVDALGAPVAGLAFSADGSTLVGISAQGLVGVWRAGSTGTPTLRLAAPDDPEWQLLPPRSLVFENGVPVVIDNRDRSAPGITIVADTGSAGEVSIRNVTLSADGSTVVAEQLAAFAERAPGDAETQPLTPSTVVISVDSNERWTLPEQPWFSALSPDGKYLVAVGGTSASSGALTVWDVATHLRAATATFVELGLDAVGPPVITSDGRSMLIASSRRIVDLALPDLEILHSAKNPVPDAIALQAVSGTDDVVVTGHGDGTIVRLDMATGEVSASGNSPGGEPLVNIAVSGDGSVVVAQDVDEGTYEVFDADTLATISGPLPSLGAVSTGDAPPIVDEHGGIFVVEASERKVVVHDVDPAWESLACAMLARNLTQEEWDRLIGPDEPYRPTCTNLPSG